MAEETTTTTEPAKGEEGKTAATTKTEEVAAQAENPDAVKRALDAERKAAKDAAKRAEAAEAKVREFEEKDKSELEKASSRAKTLEGEAAQTKAENLRLRVALEKKVPAELIDRLKGETQQEIEADAEELLKLVSPSSGATPSFDAGARASTAGTAADMDAAIRQAGGR